MFMLFFIKLYDFRLDMRMNYMYWECRCVYKLLYGNNDKVDFNV